LEIQAFAGSRLMTERRVAVELSMKNPNAAEYTMVSLSGELGLKRDYGITRDFFN
jgi:hypothetical protein